MVTKNHGLIGREIMVSESDDVIAYQPFHHWSLDGQGGYLVGLVEGMAAFNAEIFAFVFIEKTGWLLKH